MTRIKTFSGCLRDKIVRNLQNCIALLFIVDSFIAKTVNPFWHLFCFVSQI